MKRSLDQCHDESIQTYTPPLDDGDDDYKKCVERKPDKLLYVTYYELGGNYNAYGDYLVMYDHPDYCQVCLRDFKSYAKCIILDEHRRVCYSCYQKDRLKVMTMYFFLLCNINFDEELVNVSFLDVSYIIGSCLFQIFINNEMIHPSHSNNVRRATYLYNTYFPLAFYYPNLCLPSSVNETLLHVRFAWILEKGSPLFLITIHNQMSSLYGHYMLYLDKELINEFKLMKDALDYIVNNDDERLSSVKDALFY